MEGRSLPHPDAVCDGGDLDCGSGLLLIIRQAFEPLGFPTEGRAFRPHMTLGRTARNARPRDLAGLEAAFAQIPFDRTVTISELDLMQSTLRPDGPVYQVRYHERLS